MCHTPWINFTLQGQNMDKNIVLLISLSFINSTGFSQELPDFCKTGEFICHEVSPDYVIAYPRNNQLINQQNEIKTSHSYQNVEQQFSNDKDLIDIDLSSLTWSAYDMNGALVRTGRVSGGKEFCADTGRNCETIIGTFTVYRKGGEDCKSTIYPVGRGGAPMPYCMFFHGGYALHGSYSVPNYNASHGCVRMTPEDAQWLNEDFVIEGTTKVRTHY